MSVDLYTAELSKGQGIVQETVTLLNEWQPGMNATELYKAVLSSGILGRASAQRTKDLVVRCFASRYLGENMPARNLKKLAEKGFSANDLSQTFMLYTSRTNRILYDFIRDVYWPSYGAGLPAIHRDDSRQFIQKALDEGRMVSRWSESTQSRIARYLLSTMADFGLLGADHSGRREILPYMMTPITALYLAHELHFHGCSDNGVVENQDWHLFGLQRHDVVRQLERAGRDLSMIVQDSGDLTRISWQVKTMEEFIDAIPR
jgi:hypothetical protein